MRIIGKSILVILAAAILLPALAAGVGEVEYRPAEEAMEKLNYANLGGLKLHIEWSKSSGRYNPDTARRHKSRSRSREYGRGSKPNLSKGDLPG